MHISINKKEGEIMEKTVILFAFVFVMCSSIICHGQNDDMSSIRQISFSMKSLGKWYQCLTYCFYGKPSVLHVCINADQYSSKMVSEYSYDDKNDNWYINGYHTNPPKITAKRLLRAYLKIYKRNNLSYKIETTKILKGIDYL